jgi:UDP-GlcNAc:undecaprenyl-phosphate GlcNAc-1-phosphate transferase
MKNIVNHPLFFYYVVFFCGAFVFGLMIYFLLLRFVRTLGVRDLNEYNLVRWTTQTKPSLGGLGFYLVFLLSFAVLSVVPIDGGDVFNRKVFGVFTACTVGFLLGLADDAYNTNPLVKFIGQFVCGAILVASNLVVPISPHEGFNTVFTLIWVVGMMNSVNMLDNMDGITTSVSIAALLGGLAFLFTGHGPDEVSFMIYGVLAALVGFLWYNWHPSRMYMGDTGSMFLGVFLSAISILLFWDNRVPSQEWLQLRQFLIPLMVFLMPITDTLTVFGRRLMRRQSPFVGGKDHTTHQLAFLGLPDWGVGVVFSIMSLLGVSVAFWIHTQRSAWTFGLTIGVLIFYALFFVLVQIVYEFGKRRHSEQAKHPF